MKRILCWILLTYALVMGAYADRPSWTDRLPLSTNPTYSFKVTVGEAKTYDEAYSKALARAILETSWRISGVTVKVTDDLGSLEQDISRNLETISKEVRLQINKVCEYTEHPVGSMRVKLYVLWQMPNDGYVTPQFEPFNCE